MERSNDQDKAGFIYGVHLQCSLCISEFLEAVFLVQVNATIPIVERGCQCKYLSSTILLLSFPCPKLYCGIQ